MPKYRLTGKVVGRIHLCEIDAESEHDAINRYMCSNRPEVPLTRLCTSLVSDATIEDIEAEEAKGNWWEYGEENQKTACDE